MSESTSINWSRLQLPKEFEQEHCLYQRCSFFQPFLSAKLITALPASNTISLALCSQTSSAQRIAWCTASIAGSRLSWPDSQSPMTSTGSRCKQNMYLAPKVITHILITPWLSVCNVLTPLWQPAIHKFWSSVGICERNYETASKSYSATLPLDAKSPKEMHLALSNLAAAPAADGKACATSHPHNLAACQAQYSILSCTTFRCCGCGG